MDAKVFFEIDGRPLYLDSYLVDFDVPIFYICRDDEFGKYAVMCINSHNDEYVIAKTSNEKIKAMLENKITLYDFMAQAGQKWNVAYDKKIDNDKVESIKRLNDENLPEKGEYLDLHNKRIADYLMKINNEIKENDLSRQIHKLFDKYQLLEKRTLQITWKTKKNVLSVDHSKYRTDLVRDDLNYFSFFIKASVKNIAAQQGSVSAYKQDAYQAIFYNVLKGAQV